MPLRVIVVDLIPGYNVDGAIFEFHVDSFSRCQRCGSYNIGRLRFLRQCYSFYLLQNVTTPLVQHCIIQCPNTAPDPKLLDS